MSDQLARVSRVEVWPQSARCSRAAREDGCGRVHAPPFARTATTFARALDTLDTAERERFERYLNTEVARRFAVGRLRLREMLGRRARRSHPQQCRSGSGCTASRRSTRASQRVGVSASASRTARSCSRRAERGGRRREWTWSACGRSSGGQRVAERVFGPDGSRRRIDAKIAGGDDPSSAFFRFWCRAEAELKATGTGISGLTAHRNGWRPPGLRIAELPDASVAGRSPCGGAAVSVRRRDLRAARRERLPERGGAEPRQKAEDHPDERVHGVVEPAVHRGDGQQPGRKRDHHADAALKP